MPEGWTFQGLPAGQVALVAGIGAALVILYFLLRPRPPVVEVSSHVLWDKVLPKRRNPLLKELLMVALQLAAVVALALALGDPRKDDDEDTAAEQLADGVILERVWVVDRSLSMGAVDADGRTRIDRVGRLLRDELAGLDPRVSVGVIGASSTPELLAPVGLDRERVALALRLLDVDGVTADLSAAVAMSPPGALVEVFTDAADAGALATDRIVIRAPFEPRANVAITAFDLRASEGIPAEEEAVVRLSNRSTSPAEVELRLETVDSILGQATVMLAPGAEVVRRYRFRPLDGSGIEAVLRRITFEDGSHDALAADDRAYAWVQPVTPISVLLVTDGNRFLERVLSLLPGASVDRIKPAAWSRRAGSADAYDVVFLDGFVPNGRQPARAFYVAPPAGGPFAVERMVAAPAVTDWNHDHPLFKGLVLRDLHVQTSAVLTAGPDDVRLIGSPAGPLALARETASGRSVGWGFDFGASDLPLRLAFPQTMVNTLLWMRDGRAVGQPPGGRHALGDPLWVGPDGVSGAPRAETNDEVAASAGGDDEVGAWIGLTDLGQQAVALAQDDERGAQRATTRWAVGDGPRPLRLPHPGLWRLDGPGWSYDVAVNLGDNSESSLASLPAHDGARIEPPPVLVADEEPDRNPLWLLLALGTGAVLLGEFGLYTR
ncbi:MAG: VWA domain-containing protein [Proteobacteria bacterium]|nr:VWA domain-containing protein [Pseudomonadota bacterium]